MKQKVNEMNRMQKFVANAKKYGVSVAAVGGLSALAAAPAHADYMAEIGTALSTAKDNALTIGGYVLVAVGSLIVISLILKVINKI